MEKQRLLEEAKRIYKETWILVKEINRICLKSWEKIKVSWEEIKQFIF